MSLVSKEQAQNSIPGLADKIAVVTGGASGIGKMISKKLAFFGAQVAIIDVDRDKGNDTASEITFDGHQAMFCYGSVDNRDEISSCMQSIDNHMGGIDILVNNAGIAKYAPFEEIILEDWDRVLRINLTGSFICSQTATPYLAKRGGGKIIMVSSGSATTGSGGGAHYAASKGGMNSLVRAMARELAPKRILVNAVAPRSIESEMLSTIYSKEDRERMARSIPIGRLGTAEDIANIVAFLAGGLSDFINGEVLLADGGRTYCG